MSEEKKEVKKKKQHTIYKGSDKKRVPSVTTILGGNLGWNKRMLLAWTRREALAGNDPNAVRDEAADIGTATHNLIEHHIYGAEYDTSKLSFEALTESNRGLEAYIEWEKKVDINYLEVELQSVSDKYKFGGTLDGLVEIDGETILLDFKTSKGIYSEYLAQLAAYRQLVHENTDYKIDRCIIVHIKKGELEEGAERVGVHYIPNSMIDDGWKVFSNCVELHELNKKIKVKDL